MAGSRARRSSPGPHAGAAGRDRRCHPAPGQDRSGVADRSDRPRIAGAAFPRSPRPRRLFDRGARRQPQRSHGGVEGIRHRMGAAGAAAPSARDAGGALQAGTPQGQLGEAGLAWWHHARSLRIRRTRRTTGRLMNFGTIFDLPLKMWPGKEALIYGPHRIAYRTLEERTNRVANGLAALGIGVGDHVAVLVKNDHRFVETLLGALRTGASVTPATTRAHLSTLAHIMQD